MLQATYKTSPYTFYLSTEDNRIDTSKTDTDNLVYSFKLTNDMSGEIQYAFGQNQAVYDRYTKLQLTHNLTPLTYAGRVNLVPNGYWNYELYEYSGDITLGPICAVVPNVAGVYGTLRISEGGTLDFYHNLTNAGLIDQFQDGLTQSGVSAYWQFNMYDNCDSGKASIYDGFTVTKRTAQSNDERWLEVTDYTTTATGCTVTIKSNAPTNYSYDFMSDQSGSDVYYQVTNITTNPQTTIHTFTYATNESLFALRMYDAVGGNAGSGSLVWVTGQDTFVRLENPNDIRYALSFAGAYNNISIDGSATILDKGNVWFTSRYGAVGTGTGLGSAEKNYYELQGLITQGKLYVSEPSGEEQVQYLENSPASGTNYIWYGQ
jgi:hypothetical protein